MNEEKNDPLPSSYLIRIVDDEAAVREGLQFMLKAEGYRIALYTSAEEFCRKDDFQQPGVLVLDVKMPGLSGYELFAQLQNQNFPYPIIFLSGHGTITMAVEQMKRGAFDFMEKPIDPDRFLKRLQAALSYLDRQKRQAQGRLAVLTHREWQIVQWILRGLSNKEMAAALSLSERTVETHRASAYRKLGVNTAKSLAELLQRTH